MDNHIFYRRFRIGVILFFVLIVILSIVWFTSQENNKKEDVTFEELLNTEKETTNEDFIDWENIDWENTDLSYWDSINMVITSNPSYYRADNVYLIKKFKGVIKELYLMYGIKADPEDYINFKVSIPNPEKYGINEWYFLAVDNYRRFLSDTAECNKGNEPLKTFISKGKDFIKSRTSLSKEEMDLFQSCKFSFLFEHLYENKFWVHSWEELNRDKASFLIWYNQDDYIRYIFTRNGGFWYLTDYYPRHLLINE